MKVKQTVTTKFHNVHSGWNSLDFYEENGDEVQIRMTDDDYLSLSDTLLNKANRIRQERAEEAAKLEKENEDG